MRRLLRVPFFTQMMSWTMVMVTLVMGVFPSDMSAMMAPPLPTTTDSTSESRRWEDLHKLQTVLESKVVRQRLRDIGLTPEEINTRLSRLSDDQLHQLATNVEAMIPAGDGLGIVIALLVIAILVVILIYLLNHRIIVTKNNPDK
jgi:Family of unknown function (DUF6627)